jgi:23S rRNA (uracil1939-C5)-methyltransferase
LARISSPEIVYVSCDPVTLARDLKLLVAAGYNIAEMHMVDMFPQTFHLETMVILRR